MTGVTVGVLLLAALVLLLRSDGRRLHRVLAHDLARRPVRDSVRGADLGADLRAAPGAVPGDRPGARARTLARRGAQAPVRAEVVAEDVARLGVLLRAGLPPARAWSHLVEVAGPGPGGAWASAAGASAAGDPVAPALRGVLARRPGSDEATAALVAVAAAWEVSERTGAPAAQLLRRLAGALREEADARDAREAALAAPRATARLLLALPALGLLLGHALGAAPLLVLVGTAPGRLAGAVGAALALAGWVWTRRLVAAAAVPPAAPAGRGAP